MIKSEFRRIAEKYDAKFKYQDNDISIGMGARSPRVIYKLTLEHSEIGIILLNETGTAYVGSVSSSFKTVKHSLDFSINTNTHFSRVFSRSKLPFKIKSSNLNLNAFLRDNQNLKRLETIANKTKFEPYIRGSYEENLFQLKVDYHLQFSDWQHVIEPLLDFYKDFIEEFSA